MSGTDIEDNRPHKYTVGGHVTLTEGEAAEAACALLGLPRLSAVALLRFSQELNGFLQREREAWAADVKARMEGLG